MTHVLVVEGDENIRWALRTLLEHAEYSVETASTRDEALALIAEETFQLILTDSFAERQRDALRSLRPIYELVRPTPVAVVTAWNVQPEDIDGSGFAFVQTMPFDVERLLAQVAAAICLPLTPDQERQSAVVRRYFEALSSRDWDGLIAICAPNVTYTLPAPTPFAAVQVGREAFRVYTVETFAQFRDARFQDVEVYASPSGLASRYRGVWSLADGTQAVMSGAVYFEFDGEFIRQIGVLLNDERLRALLETPPTRTASSQPTE